MLAEKKSRAEFASRFVRTAFESMGLKQNPDMPNQRNAAQRSGGKRERTQSRARCAKLKSAFLASTHGLVRSDSRVVGIQHERGSAIVDWSTAIGGPPSRIGLELTGFLSATVQLASLDIAGDLNARLRDARVGLLAAWSAILFNSYDIRCFWTLFLYKTMKHDSNACVQCCLR